MPHNQTLLTLWLGRLDDLEKIWSLYDYCNWEAYMNETCGCVEQLGKFLDKMDACEDGEPMVFLKDLVQMEKCYCSGMYNSETHE